MSADSGGAEGDSPGREAELVEIHHGTDLASAVQIRDNGVDRARMVEYYSASADFCTTTCLRTAKQYSGLNNAVMMDGATPAVFSAKLPAGVVQVLRASNLVKEIHEDRAMEFPPAAFAVLNAAMTDRTVTLAADISFDE